MHACPWLCLQAAELTRSCCVSVVHAKDMVPRLSVANMEQLVEVRPRQCRAGGGGVQGREQGGV